MATVHKTFRLDAELVERMGAWAEAEGLRQGEAVGRLITLGLEAVETAVEASERPQEAVSEGGGTDVPEGGDEALQALISSLTRQMEAKDEQIASLMRMNDQSQQLQAAQAQQIRALLPEQAEGGEIVTTRKTWRQRLGAWIAGEGR